ncbi:hypothetical protein Mapa_013303 [Marchantia paleacea]|nr:hypothetical protein Mapa_013303 [Marchantia paleacea]
MSPSSNIQRGLKAVEAFFALTFMLLVKTPSVAGLPPSEVVVNLLLVKVGLGDTLGQLSDWVPSDSSPCAWTGITCSQVSVSDNGSSVVIGLDLSNKNLTGSIPHEIGLLTNLQVLDLNSNGLTGQIPLSIINLTQLTFINLTSNLLNGSLPVGISAMKSLQKLDVYDNLCAGPLPEELGLMTELVYLHLGGNAFQGDIPASYWNLDKLVFLNLAGNKLTGSLPPAIGNLTSLTWLEMGYNRFTTELPHELGNLRELTYLDFSWANISGQIPRELGMLSKLGSLFLYSNRISGPIPAEIGNMSAIWSIDLSNNSLSGSIPPELGNLKQSRFISLWANNLTGNIPPSFGDFPHLLTLLLWNNSLSGSLPQQLGLASSLGHIDVSSNQLSGSIPPELCKSGALWRLILFNNAFTGSLPAGLASCPSLYRVRIQNNQLTGPIPAGFGFLPYLAFLDLSRNQLNGSLPADIVSASELTFIDLSFNRITGTFPSSEAVWTFYNLQEFYAAGNELYGNIPPQFGNVSSLGVLDLSGNAFSGHIPSSLCNCSRLVNLNLSNNRLIGEIPSLFGNMMDLASLDLSRNELDGEIPTTLQNLSTLDALNVSYNNLEGPVPTSGVFQFLNASSFIGNPALCGQKVLRQCTGEEHGGKKGKNGGAVAFMIAGIFLVALGVVIVGICCFYKQYHWQIRRVLKGGTSTPTEWPWTLTTFQRLNFSADEVVGCLKESNIIGMGGAGTVYKGEFPGGDIVAVKRLWGSRKPEHMGKDQGFSAEVDLLGSIRHRNIVRLLGFCSNHETNLLIYEYMPNGSLGELLHGWKNSAKRDGNKVNILADWLTRFNIAMGVAQGLAYLHHDCCPPIVHRDVKSNNILLDTNMEARVADFGLAKLFESNQSMSLVAGSYGYIAPEYAYTLKVDEKSDIYSLGVVLLELLTGRQPVETTDFGESVNIVEWVTRKMASKEGLLEVLDPDVGSGCYSVQEEMIMVLRIALLCTSRLPKDRPSMRDVVTMLSEAQPRRKTAANESSFRSRFV